MLGRYKQTLEHPLPLLLNPSLLVMLPSSAVCSGDVTTQSYMSTALLATFPFLAYIVHLKCAISFGIMAKSLLMGTAVDNTKSSLKRALSEYKVLGIESP